MSTPRARASALLGQAFALHQSGQLQQAAALYDQVLVVEPANFDALHLLGVIAALNDDAPRATQLLTEALARNPGSGAAWHNLGLARLALKQWQQALAAFDAALALHPDDAKAHERRAQALLALNDPAAALFNLDRALSLNPQAAEIHYDRGVALQLLGRHQEALDSFRIVTHLRPDNAAAHNGCGVMLYALKQTDAALACYAQALALQPDLAEAWCNRGLALHATAQFSDAITSYDNAIARNRAYADAYNNRGLAMQEMLQTQAAMSSFQQAIALQADHAEANWNASLCALQLGDFEHGWATHEWRWRRPGPKDAIRDPAQSMWTGSESLQGKSILLRSEQGLGDTLQFSRYGAALAEAGARVILEAPQVLLPVLRTLDGVAQLLARGATLPAFDYYCPLLSLPAACKTGVDSIPLAAGYLAAAPDKLAHWRGILGQSVRKRVGLVWSGSSTLKNDHNRSIGLAELLPWLPPQFEYVSLQQEVRATDVAALQASPDIMHFGADLRDFADTAAICELLDLVISVDTAVAHLCGTIGAPVWILLPFNPDWRWMLERNDSPWYGSARLYRQQRAGHWEHPLAQIGADLLREFGPD